MAIIVPAIIPGSYDHLRDTLARFAGAAPAAQIDLVDGRYAAPASWPYAGCDGPVPEALVASGVFLPELGVPELELDLMAEHPLEDLSAWEALGVSRIVIHAASTRNLSLAFDALDRRFGHETGFTPNLLSIGIALGASMDPAMAEPFLSRVDYVQFMGIRSVGRQGEPFDNGVIARIRQFRRAHPGMPVQVDGGVDASRVEALVMAGADRLVVGSAILRAEDPVAAYRALAQKAEAAGRFVR